MILHLFWESLSMTEPLITTKFSNFLGKGKENVNNQKMMILLHLLLHHHLARATLAPEGKHHEKQPEGKHLGRQFLAQRIQGLAEEGVDNQIIAPNKRRQNLPVGKHLM
jgi:hypothetical protein